jgi:hypothetical protein
VSNANEASTASNIKELLELLRGVAPSVVGELESKINDFGKESYSRGYNTGRDEYSVKETAEKRESFLRGEANGMVWAYHAAHGSHVFYPDNPFVSPKIVEGLAKIRR